LQGGPERIGLLALKKPSKNRESQGVAKESSEICGGLFVEMQALRRRKEWATPGSKNPPRQQQHLKKEQ
jgi:hypothetical protein